MSEVLRLFPMSVYKSTIGRHFTSDELTYVKECSNDVRPNPGNHTTSSYFITEHPAMADIRGFINQQLKDYFQSEFRPLCQVEPYVTQSWLNYTNPGEHHHIHTHSNSFLSGVLYLNADPEVDKIVFLSDRRPILEVQSNYTSPHHSQVCRVPVGTGDLIIFPSNLVHMVEQTPTCRTMTRISLAFNSYLRGDVAAPNHPIYLKL